MQNSYGENTVVYAGFWVRFAAFLVDSLIVGIFLLIVRLAMFFGFSVFSILDMNLLDERALFAYTWKDIILYLAGAAYYIICTYCAGTTAGKWLFNLRVVSADGLEGKKLTLTDVVYRETIGKFLSGVVMNIGYILAGMDREKRALHDMLCDTRVIYAKRVKVIPVRPRQYAYTGPRGPVGQNTPGPGNAPYNAPYTPYGPDNRPGVNPPDMPYGQNKGSGMNALNTPYGQSGMPHGNNSSPGMNQPNMSSGQNPGAEAGAFVMADSRNGEAGTGEASASPASDGARTADLRNAEEPENTAPQSENTYEGSDGDSDEERTQE